MKPTIEIHGVGFSTDLDCFHWPPLPEASCCPMNPCSFSVDVVVGGVGVHGYPVLLISPLYCLLMFIYTDLQWSLGLSNVHLGAVLARNLVDHFLLFLFRHLVLHSHKPLLQCTSLSGPMESGTCNSSMHTSIRCPPTFNSQLRKRKRGGLHSWMSW